MIYEDPWHSVYFSCHLWSFEPVDGSLAEALSLCVPSTRSNFRTASITSSLVFELTPDRQTHSSKVTKIVKQFQTWSNFKPFRWFRYCCQVAGHHFVGDVDLTTCRSLPHLPCLPPGSMRCNLWWQFSPQDKHWWSKQNWRPVLFNLFPWKGLRSGHLCNERPNTHTLLSHQPCLAMDVFRAISNKAGTVAEVWRSAGFTDKLLMFEFLLTLLICRTQTESAKAPPLISLDVISLIYRTWVGIKCHFACWNQNTCWMIHCASFCNWLHQVDLVGRKGEQYGYAKVSNSTDWAFETYYFLHHQATRWPPW